MNQTVQQLTRKLAAQLSQNAAKICTAESCTGGLIAKTLTDLAGSSTWFDRGFVTYSNQAKMDMLAVESSTLQQYGAVSEEVAREMVTGALQHSDAQVAISVTGIAGPGGGTASKPVGTVCFGFALKVKPETDEVQVLKKCFDGDRQQVREASLLFALKHVIELIEAGHSTV